MKDEAKANDMSLNQLIVTRLEGGTTEPRLVETIRGIFGDDLVGIVLFGSAARGERRENSDVDLLIVLDDARAIDRSLYRLWDERFPNDVYSPQFVHRPGEEVSSLWLEVGMEGEILEDRGGTIKRAMRRIREEIASGRYVRRMSHGHPYWIRQESQE